MTDCFTLEHKAWRDPWKQYLSFVRCNRWGIQGTLKKKKIVRVSKFQPRTGLMFCSSCEGAEPGAVWASPRSKCYSIPSYLMARVQGLGRRDSSPPRRSMSLSSGGLRVHPSLFSYLRLGEHSVCKSPSLGTLLSLVLLLLLFFSYLTAVSSKLFLYQPVILTFCASNFQPSLVWEGQGELRRVSKWHLAWESQWGHWIGEDHS